MFDLSQAKIIGETPLEAAAEPIVETPVSTETTEAPVIESTAEPVVEAPVNEPPKDDFPADKFGGKFKSWDEVQAKLSEDKPQYDEFLQKVIEKYQTDGSLEDFFKAYSVDYDKLSDEDVLRKDFFDRNSARGLSEKTLNMLWEKEKSKYTIDPEEFSEEEVEIGRDLMKADANEQRAKLKEQQQKFIQPKASAAPTVDLNKLKEQVASMPEVQQLRADKKVKLSVDGQEINYELTDPDFAIDTMVNDQPFYGLFNQNGKPDAAKWAKVVEFARNPEKVLKTVLDHGKTLGRIEMEAELKNTQLPKNNSETPSSPADFQSRLIQAFAERGKVTR